MEEKYSDKLIDGKDAYNHYILEDGGHYFFRGNKNTKQMIQESITEKFRQATDEYVYENDLFDQEDECGTSCMPFATP